MEVEVSHVNRINNHILNQKVLKYCNMNPDKYKMMTLSEAIAKYVEYLKFGDKSFDQWLLTEI